MIGIQYTTVLTKNGPGVKILKITGANKSSELPTEYMESEPYMVEDIRAGESSLSIYSRGSITAVEVGKIISEKKWIDLKYDIECCVYKLKRIIYGYSYFIEDVTTTQCFY